jgi:hypothetical protein
MKIRQYVTFGITSKETTAAEMTARIGIEPDRVSIKGSRIADPPIPGWHWWTIVCDQTGISVGEQISIVLNRIKSQEVEVTNLVSELKGESQPGGAQLSIVRYFNDLEGEDAEWGAIEWSKGIEVAWGLRSHHLLGWNINSDDLGLLVEVGASIDVDEYDQAESA